MPFEPAYFSLPASHSLKKEDLSVLTIVSMSVGGFKTTFTLDFEKEYISFIESILIIN
jgi:hypothetical protein